MASDSQTATGTMSEKPLENKEANLMEKEIVLSETADVVKDKPVSDSNLTVEKEEQIDQTPANVEVAAEVVKGEEESVDKGKDENGEEKVAEEVESVAEVVFQEVDEEKAEEGKGKDENGEEKVAEQGELKEPTLVKESVDAEEKAEEKVAVESVAEEGNKDKEEEEKKMVDVSESTDEAGGKQVEPVDVQLVREVSAETVDVEVLEAEPKLETSEKVEAKVEKAKELASDVEVVRTEETPETTEHAKVQPVDSIVETKDSVIKSKDEQTSEGDASSLPDVIVKAITEERQVVEEPSKDEKKKVSEEAKGVVTKLTTEEENIMKDTETPNGKSGESLKETDTESKEGSKQEESITEKVAEVLETETVAKEIDEQPEVTTKEVSVKPKHSNSIISKVKQSLVKAKKAIIGKSPSSKTITTEETKEEIIAK